MKWRRIPSDKNEQVIDLAKCRGVLMNSKFILMARHRSAALALWFLERGNVIWADLSKSSSEVLRRAALTSKVVSLIAHDRALRQELEERGLPRGMYHG